MTLRELLDMKKGLYIDYEVYTSASKFPRWHNDFVYYVLEPSMDSTVIDYELMDEERYQQTLQANCSDYADFDEWYDDKNAIVLCVMIEKEYDE